MVPESYSFTWVGKRVLIASGPTSAPLDDVRRITNRSSGRLGATLALNFFDLGALVVHLQGEQSLTAHDLRSSLDESRYRVNSFETVDELKALLMREAPQVDIILMAAAVLDYVPAEIVEGKRRSSDEQWTVVFRRGEKLIERIHEWAPDAMLVGFKLESRITVDELHARASDLMNRSGAALVVANLQEQVSSTAHAAYIIEGRELNQRIGPIQGREEIAARLAERLTIKLSQKAV
ncbi:MAG: hypothetical protein GC154_02495 [bacterium]|nr:hypothetical protein [bacterium]